MTELNDRIPSHDLGALTEEEVAASVAIIGMACRFPGADSLEELWHNLANGVESIDRFSREELLEAGVDPSLVDHPAYVPAKPRLQGVDRFDAPFFDIPPREAEILDPQTRLFLEIAWEALERAGYAVEGYPGWIGLFAGVSFPSYWVQNLAAHPELIASVGAFQVFLANDRDYFATRTSYELDLKGPSVNVQAACSTSLVAVHLACQSLLDHHCDMALAGGARVHLPRVGGYLYQEGGIVSPDGHCRSFDANGLGSVFGDGVAAVVLKRLGDALADGDPIDAVIRGSGMNNDGAGKVGFTAPSVDGQAEVIALAQAVAGIDPGTVSYVEAHGSGTPLGDPIEVAALEEVFGRRTVREGETGFCALGSVKSNFGHLEAAAGVAGLVKAVLALRHRQIPPSLHCETPNPRIDWASSPFYVATRLEDWKTPEGVPRRAGVSSFGVGGTNVHLVLEGAPAVLTDTAPSRLRQLLVVSARSAGALDTATDRLADRLEELEGDELPHLPDVAYTLMTARRRFEHRRAVVCATREEAVAALRSRDPERMQEGVGGAAAGPPVFLFSGLGDHYPGMGLGLYRGEPAFREAIDRAAEVLREALGEDLREILYPEGVDEPSDLGSGGGGGLDLRAMLGRRPSGGAETEAEARLSRVRNLHPILFAVEHALDRVWQRLGVEPAAMIGYSLGEYVAACRAGVFSFEDGLRLVAERARLIEAHAEGRDGGEEGAMLAVPRTEEATRLLLADRSGKGRSGSLAVAAVNGAGLTVVAGPAGAVAELEARLAEEGTPGRRLPASHAFHTPALAPAAGPLAAALARIELRPPEIPFVSNVTGTWITDEEAIDPEYWARHLVSPVRFAAGLEALFEAGHRAFVELGPGQALGSLVHQSASGACAEEDVAVVPSLRAAFERRSDLDRLLRSAGRLWLAGVPLHDPRDPDRGLWAGEARRRLRLPTYPFERRSYWIEPPAAAPGVGAGAGAGAAAPQAAGGATLASVHERPRLATPYVEPEGELERTLAGIWRRMLGIERVGAHDDFFELGGNSLIVPQVLFQVREAVGLELPVPALLQAPTVSSFARVVERARSEGAAALAEMAAEGAVDLRAEADLDVWDRHRPAIPAELPRGRARPLGSEPGSLFLTGGTGFFGAFVLERLLRVTEARIHCLVRAEDAGAAAARLEEALRSYRLWDEREAEGWRVRIVPWPGDLVRPRLGLAEDDFQLLAGEVDAVYHAGAWVNFTYPYRALAPSNVAGTVEALRLAATGTPKPLHFVSSIAVFAPGAVGEDGLAHEDSDLAAIEGLFSGYAETKWVAERLVRQAAQRGLPVTLHRPGVIGGGRETGAGNPRDLVWNLLKGCIQLGAAPRGIGTADVAPADYVAAALVAVAGRPESQGRAFHYPNPRPTPWDELFDGAEAAGFPLRRVEYAEWRERLLAEVKAGGENALAAFLPLLPAVADAGDSIRDPEAEALAAERVALSGRRGDDDRNTRDALEGTGIACPNLDEELLRTYLSYFVETGFLQAPARVGA